MCRETAESRQGEEEEGWKSAKDRREEVAEKSPGMLSGKVRQQLMENKGEITENKREGAKSRQPWVIWNRSSRPHCTKTDDDNSYTSSVLLCVWSLIWSEWECVSGAEPSFPIFSSSFSHYCLFFFTPSPSQGECKKCYCGQLGIKIMSRRLPVQFFSHLSIFFFDWLILSWWWSGSGTVAGSSHISNLSF